MQEITSEGYRGFFLDRARTASLATVHADGRPRGVLGAERAEDYGRRNAVRGELLVRVKSEKIFARKRIAE